MDRLKLAAPCAEYAPQIAAYRQEFLDAGSSMDGTGPLVRLASPIEWLAATEQYTKEPPEGSNLVPATQFLAIRESDGRLVGMLQVRHRFNQYLEKFGGHIGYSVRPCERRKGYANEQLRLALPFCKTLGLERVLITCIQGNEASRKVILKNGGVYESTVCEPNRKVYLERYWINLECDA